MHNCALSVAGPHAWNALPADICCAHSLDTFKKHLKSHLFSAAHDLLQLFYLSTLSHITRDCYVFYVLLLFVQCWPRLCVSTFCIDLLIELCDVLDNVK